MPVSSVAQLEGIQLICVMMAVVSIVSIECCVFHTTHYCSIAIVLCLLTSIIVNYCVLLMNHYNCSSHLVLEEINSSLIANMHAGKH